MHARWRTIIFMACSSIAGFFIASAIAPGGGIALPSPSAARPTAHIIAIAKTDRLIVSLQGAISSLWHEPVGFLAHLGGDCTGCSVRPQFHSTPTAVAFAPPCDSLSCPFHSEGAGGSITLSIEKRPRAWGCVRATSSSPGAQ